MRARRRAHEARRGNHRVKNALRLSACCALKRPPATATSASARRSGSASAAPRSAVPLADVEAIEVKRLLAGGRIIVPVRGQEIRLERSAAGNAKGVAAAFEEARGPRWREAVA